MVDPFNIDAASSRVWCHTCHPNVGRCTIASFFSVTFRKVGYTLQSWQLMLPNPVL